MLSRILIASCLAISFGAVALVWHEPQAGVARVESRAQHMAAADAAEAATLARALVHLASESCAVAPAPPAPTQASVPAPQRRQDI